MALIQSPFRPDTFAAHSYHNRHDDCVLHGRVEFGRGAIFQMPPDPGRILALLDLLREFPLTELYIGRS